MVCVSGISVKIWSAGAKYPFWVLSSCILQRQAVAVHILFLRNQPHLIVIEYIIPCPVEHDDNPVAEANDAVDVQEDPDHPGNVSAEGDSPNARDGGISSYGGEQAGVLVVKMSERFSVH